jgi:hypothetical protein
MAAKKMPGAEKAPIEERTLALRRMLEALVAMNLDFLERHRKRTGKDYPSIYEVAPKYRGPRDLGVWQDIPFTVKAGAGDAGDLVCWRVAELRAAGYDDVYPFIKMKQTDDGWLYTVQVRIQDLLEDPTAILSAGPLVREA